MGQNAIDEADDGPSAGAARRNFVICIEDREIEWKKGVITYEEILELGGWDPAKGVVEVDEDQGERTLEPGEIVKLKPGLRFGKKVRFKRG